VTKGATPNVTVTCVTKGATPNVMWSRLCVLERYTILKVTVLVPV